MSLRTDIEKLYSDNTDYQNPGQAVNQASSLRALSSDLYTDSKRFIYELLQNADDASINTEDIKVWIKLFDNKLVVAHSGKPFTVRDLQGICNINNGTKNRDIRKTGYKGIGFKSVFGQSDRVTIFTNGEFFRFDAIFPFEWIWEDSRSDWEQKNDRKFQYPWQIIPIYTEKGTIDKAISQYIANTGANVATILEIKNIEETSQAIQSLTNSLNMFIFLKNIVEISFNVEEPITVKISRNNRDRISLYKGNDLESSWLNRSIDLEVPKEIKDSLIDERNIPEKLLTTKNIELSLAAKLEGDAIKKLSNHEKLLYTYLPTDEIKYALPVLVNTSFLTTANRESLHSDSKWNQWLFETIAFEIFKWISEIVQTEFQSQAYDLIPNKVINDELGKCFNKGINHALKEIPFIVTKSGCLELIGNSIADFTYLSEKSFIGEEPIRKFLFASSNNVENNNWCFAKYSNAFRIFRKLGINSFNWSDIKGFLQSDFFISAHSLVHNIELIRHLKRLCESDMIGEVTESVLNNLPFIWDHKNIINYPNRVCFPTPDDLNWDNPNSELSFLHRELQTWLANDFETREWLEELGVVEKTDITYVEQKIIPHIDTYVTADNAINSIRELYKLYKNESLDKDLLNRLGRIKLLTQKGTLCPAEECFLSDFYSPRILLEDSLEIDFYVSSDYCISNIEKGEWKHFFHHLGVNEGISPIIYENKLNVQTLIGEGLDIEYFRTEEKKFTPFRSTFIADEFRNIVTIRCISYVTNNLGFAKEFWNDYIENFEPDDVNTQARAYWGNSNRPGRITGDNVENYISWFIRNNNCIPTENGKCYCASDAFLNTEGISSIAGNYLPVFKGPKLSQDWKSFFKFKTEIKLAEYLVVLDGISHDLNNDGELKNDNTKRIQKIYSILLRDCMNWSSNEILQVKEWAKNGQLLNTENTFNSCNEIMYFLDGNESVFQDQYKFLMLDAENRNSPSLQTLLGYFNVRVLEQSEFELVHSQEEVCNDLRDKLEKVVPYFKSWIKSDEKDETVTGKLDAIDDVISAIEFFEADELNISYEGIDFAKRVNIHYDEKNLYVTTPWNANTVLLKLPEILCRILDLVGNYRKMDFLLRADYSEIQSYFEQEQLIIPEYIKAELVLDVPLLASKKVKSFADIDVAISEKKILPEFFHLTKSDYKSLKYVERLIPRAVTNVIEYLKELSNYDCSGHYKIADSIIGGIRKNGNEITIVARPSDNNQVLIYYTSEFDVLEFVDAELWCEDGITTPKQITFGNLLRKSGINRIPVESADFSGLSTEYIQNCSKSVDFEFDPVPFTPQKLAKVISSFANTSGGTIIFGVKEINPGPNDIVGVSSDFQVVNIANKAISMLSPIPQLKYNWQKYNGKNVFIIEVEEDDTELLFEGQKYTRVGSVSTLENEIDNQTTELTKTSFDRTIAIIISIENYKQRKDNQIPDVKYAKNDAIRFKDTLVNCMSIDEDDIHMIHDEEALKSTLEYDFSSLFNTLTEKDRIIFYYVGHGFHDGVTNYLSTYDMHPYNIASTAVSLRKILIDPLRLSNCKNALIFIDSCAQSFQHENMRNHLSNIIEEELLVVFKDFPYYAMFLSCQVGQSSYSSNKLSHGVWTYHLTEALKGEVSQCQHANRYITDRSLNDYLSSCVPDYVKNELGFEQNPKAVLDSSSENVIVDLEI